MTQRATAQMTQRYNAPRRALSAPHVRHPMLAWTASTDVYRACLFTVLLVNLSSVHMYLGPVRLLRPGLLAVGIAILTLVLRPRVAAWSNLRESWVAKAVGVLLLLACLSAIFGLSMVTSGLLISRVYLRNLLLFFLLVLAIRNVKDLAFLMWSFVISVGVIVVLAQTVLEMDVTMEGLGRLSGGQGHFDANDLGLLMVMALPLAVMLFFNSKSMHKLVNGLIMVGIPVTIALTGSRGALIGLGVVSLGILIFLKRFSVFKRGMVLVVAVVALAMAAPEGYWKQMGTLLNLDEDYNTTEYGRTGLWKRGVGYMFRYPVLGVGVANFGRAEIHLSSLARARAMAGEALYVMAPHNTYVQVGAEMGIPALSIWLAILGAGSIGLWRLRRRLPPSWEWESSERHLLRESCLFLPLAFIGFAVTSFFVSHAYTFIAYIIFGFLAGVHVLVRRELNKDARNGRGTSIPHSPHGDNQTTLATGRNSVVRSGRGGLLNSSLPRFNAST